MSGSSSPPGSGKTTLFTALTGVRPEGYGTPHVGIAPIADERLPQIAEVVGSAKQTPATIRLIDVPGAAAAQLGGVRRSDALLAVVRDTDDLPSLELELLVADQDHVERRLERVERTPSPGDPTLRAEAELLERLVAHIDDERALRDWPGELPAELEPLTTKPLIPIVNGRDGSTSRSRPSSTISLPTRRRSSETAARRRWRTWSAGSSPSWISWSSSRPVTPRPGPGR